MKRKIAALLLIMMLTAMLPSGIAEEAQVRELTVLFTSDIHSYFESYKTDIEGTVREHGGAGRLKTLIDTYENDHSIYVDAGDFAMGTLLHAGYSENAYELRLLGNAGCDVTTFGNHEFDFAGMGAAQMLESALRSGDPLPRIVIPANMKFDAEMNEEQTALYNALQDHGAEGWFIFDVNGIRVAVFGLLGSEASMYAPTSGVQWEKCADAAKRTVKEIGDRADVIICISHSGTKGDGKTGEDFDLIRAVPEIDVVISGHSHTAYHEVITKDGACLGSCGEYLSFLGKMELSVDGAGKVTCTDYTLIPCDENVASDPETDAKVALFRKNISETYLGTGDLKYDSVIAHSDFDMMSLSDMYAEWTEYAMGELIADSYLYKCAEAGVDDVDVAMVGLGTIRGSIVEGDITVANAFEIASLGVGADGSAGHPLLCAYVRGKDLKFLTELESIAGGMMPSFRMSYAGMHYNFDVNRVPFDRVKDLCIVRADGTSEPVEPQKLYKTAINMYAANLLGQLKDRSFGIVNMNPLTAAGEPIAMEDYYDHTVVDTNGREVKEWEALRDYLRSFEKRDGVSIIPAVYSEPLGRKIMKHGKGLEIFTRPGTATLIVLAVCVLIIVLIFALIATRKQRRLRRAQKRAARRNKTRYMKVDI